MAAAGLSNIGLAKHDTCVSLYSHPCGCLSAGPASVVQEATWLRMFCGFSNSQEREELCCTWLEASTGCRQYFVWQYAQGLARGPHLNMYAMYSASTNGSLMATTSRSSCCKAARSTNLPIRPKPLMPTLTTLTAMPGGSFCALLVNHCKSKFVSLTGRLTAQLV